ncbi:MAG: MBL fold metallo-hydrolase [Peptostreptococcaceae bacterium]|nr:MBL fold metallo-hydrolase [Peptostreptococcaceae bacterium]
MEERIFQIRAVLESFGANVSWNNTSQTVMVSATNGKVMTIHYIEVGQGDSIFIDYGNYEVLIDAGTAGYGAKVVNYIKPYVDGNLEFVICTHIHADHIGGIPAVLAAYNVEMVIDSGEVGTTATWRNYMAAVDKEGCTFLVDEDMQIGIGENTWLNIYDIADGDSDTNNNSVIVRYIESVVLLWREE